MGQIGVVVFSLLAVAFFITLSFQRWMLDALIEAIHNFRGGPPTGMHPSPVNDGFLLRKRSRKVAD